MIVCGTIKGSCRKHKHIHIKDQAKLKFMAKHGVSFKNPDRRSRLNETYYRTDLKKHAVIELGYSPKTGWWEIVGGLKGAYMRHMRINCKHKNTIINGYRCGPNGCLDCGRRF
jgi:UDP-N-acetylenolpyruvoylglucosamine reductase